MMRLPVIVGFGGISAAGRSSGHHGYRRMVIDALGLNQADQTYLSLASLMGLEGELSSGLKEQIRSGTLVRRIEKNHFNVDAILWNKRLVAHSADQPLTFVAQRKHLPDHLPEGWQLKDVDDKQVRVESEQGMAVLLPTTREGAVKAAGQLPSGFDPSKTYRARSHPRGLQMTVYGASDALASCGLDWDQLQQRVSPDQISVYAGSGMSQLDANGNGGMVKARYNGKKVTSKYCPFGFAEMPADFINAYVLGSLGNTGTNMGACASFLYNLRQGINDIQSGRARIAIIGNSEAPITPEIIEGYAAMGALATDKDLRELENIGGDQSPNYRRACRPFADNRGFTIAESAQFIVLFDDELALETGALIHGSVSDVFVNADGYKKSISAPGVGNYVTMAKAVAAARAILGEEVVRNGGFVQAHGTGTPQNRVTESHILNQTARNFGIKNWPVAAVKSYVGHSIGAAAGDQIVATLGAWEYGLLPGITTIDKVAEDVHHSNLHLDSQHLQMDSKQMAYAVINAKGFGGNNASATMLAPSVTRKMMERRHGSKAWQAYQLRCEKTQSKADDYDKLATTGNTKPVYRFDHNVLSSEDIVMDAQQLQIKGRDVVISLELENRYKDMV